jgi:cyclomaltodextrin glucanotransferase
MHEHKGQFFMFGEVWTNGDFQWLSSYTRLGTRPGGPMESGMSVLDMPGSAMNTWGQLEGTFKGGDYREVDAIVAHDPQYRDATYLVSYLDNHDKPRFNGTGADGRPAAKEHYLDALNWYFTSRGIPCIYYGTEVQMPGGNDPDNRRMLGVAGITRAKGDPVYGHLRMLNSLRKASLALQKGSQRKLLGDKDAYAFRRDWQADTALVFLNKGGAETQLDVGGVPDGSYLELVTGRAHQLDGGRASVRVPAHDLRVLAKGRVLAPRPQS